MASKRYGLRLSLGGAPNTPHYVPGIPGTFRPDIPTPVGDDGEIDLGQAREFSTSVLPVELKEMGSAEADRAKKLQAETAKEARRNRVAVPPDVVLAEAAREAKE